MRNINWLCSDPNYELPLSLSLAPLGLSILCFLSSIFFGFSIVNSMSRGIAVEVELKKIQHGQDDLAGNDPMLQKRLYEGISKNIPILGARATRAFKLQLRLLYLGVLFFIAWRVWEMYLISPILVK